MKYKMGFSSKILLSEKTLPSKFHCQEDYKRLGESDRQSAVVVQRKRKREKELVRHVEEGCHLEVQNMKDTVQKGVNIVRDEIKPDEDTSGAQGRKTTTDILQMIDKSIQVRFKTNVYKDQVTKNIFLSHGMFLLSLYLLSKFNGVIFNLLCSYPSYKYNIMPAYIRLTAGHRPLPI